MRDVHSTSAFPYCAQTIWPQGSGSGGWSARVIRHAPRGCIAALLSGNLTLHGQDQTATCRAAAWPTRSRPQFVVRTICSEQKFYTHSFVKELTDPNNDTLLLLFSFFVAGLITDKGCNSYCQMKRGSVQISCPEASTRKQVPRPSKVFLKL